MKLPLSGGLTKEHQLLSFSHLSKVITTKEPIVENPAETLEEKTSSVKLTIKLLEARFPSGRELMGTHLHQKDSAFCIETTKSGGASISLDSDGSLRIN